MKVTCSDTRFFTLTADDGTFLGKLEYEKWKFLTASMTTQFADFYEFKSKGFWGTRIVVTTNNNEFAEITMSWKGELVVDLADDDTERSYILRSHGLWKQYFEMEDRWGNKLFILRPVAHYMSYNYEVEVNPDFQDLVREHLILLGVYCANYYMQAATAAAA